MIKKLLIIILYLSISELTSAQDFERGFRHGFNLGTNISMTNSGSMDFYEYDKKFHLGLGPFVGLYLNARDKIWLDWQFELNFGQQLIKTGNFTRTRYYGGPTGQLISINSKKSTLGYSYLQLPVLIRFKFFQKRKLFMEMGGFLKYTFLNDSFSDIKQTSYANIDYSTNNPTIMVFSEPITFEFLESITIPSFIRGITAGFGYEKKIKNSRILEFKIRMTVDFPQIGVPGRDVFQFQSFVAYSFSK